MLYLAFFMIPYFHTDAADFSRRPLGALSALRGSRRASPGLCGRVSADEVFKVPVRGTAKKPVPGQSEKGRLLPEPPFLPVRASALIVPYPVLESLEEGYLIEIIKLMKANGENAQISYSKKFNFWVIASKNVCLNLCI